jgi:uncharacterized protein
MLTPFIFRLAVFIIAILVLRWFLRQFLSNKKFETKSKPPASTGNMVKDPVCGMYMDPRLAVKHEIKNGVFYFCSEECKNKFLRISRGQAADKPSADA